MELEISTSETNSINFAPSNIYEEVAQNVKYICATRKFSVPMDRNFGVDADFLDFPTPKAMASIQAEMIRAIRKYEPRCKVKKISFESDIDGKLTAKVRIEVNEE